MKLTNLGNGACTKKETNLFFLTFLKTQVKQVELIESLTKPTGESNVVWLRSSIDVCVCPSCNSTERQSTFL